jgi:hypothetical protein
MMWGDIDFARDYLSRGGGKRPTRKAVYLMVRRDGLKVARVGASGRRIRFSAEWIDEFLSERAAMKPPYPITAIRRTA